MGACRREELSKIETNNVEDLEKALLVNIPDSKTKTIRQFVIGGSFYNICKKYLALRPPNADNNRLFLNYQRGKCTKQPVGINKFGSLACQVASFLDLPNPASYTGHCLRKSSATILVDSGPAITPVKQHGRRRSTPATKSYIDSSLNNEMLVANKLLRSIEVTKSASEHMSVTTILSETVSTPSNETPERNHGAGAATIKRCRLQAEQNDLSNNSTASIRSGIICFFYCHLKCHLAIGRGKPILPKFGNILTFPRIICKGLWEWVSGIFPEYSLHMFGFCTSQ